MGESWGRQTDAEWSWRLRWLIQPANLSGGLCLLRAKPRDAWPVSALMGYEQRQRGEEEVRRSKKKKMDVVSFNESYHVISSADPIQYALLICSQPAYSFLHKNKQKDRQCAHSACLPWFLGTQCEIADLKRFQIFPSVSLGKKKTFCRTKLVLLKGTSFLCLKIANMKRKPWKNYISTVCVY